MAGLDAFQKNREQEIINTDQKARIGIIGTGGIAHSHMNAYLNMPDVEIVAGCDLVPGLTKAFSRNSSSECQN